MRKYLLISLCLCMLSGCHVPEQEDDNGDVIKSESLIELYILATSTNPIRIPFTEGAPIGKGEQGITLNNSEAERVPLMEMRQRYDDTHYNSYKRMGYYVVYANDFIAMDLVSDTDFNGIKAGESLGGIVRLHSLSPYRWLISGSKVTFDWTLFNDVTFWPNNTSALPIKQLFPVNSYLKDLSPNDLKLLMVNHTFLYFEELPTIKKHTLTLTFYEADSAISSSTQVVFQ